MRFDPVAALRALSDAGVEFVVIGGFAGALYGSTSVTWDLDICYERTNENIESLVAVLKQAQARLRGADEDVAFLLDAETISQGDAFTFNTDFGPLDILGIPAGAGGYDQLKANAVRMDLGDDVQVWVAAVEDLIAMKQAAGRPKDLIEVEVLGALLQELEEQDVR